MGRDKNRCRLTAAEKPGSSAKDVLNGKNPETGYSWTGDDSPRFLHEMKIQQIELELQNAELHQSRHEAETALEKYTDLYDLAPVGYFVLDNSGMITTANLRGAALLGVVRSRLIGRRFARYVIAEDCSTFTAFLDTLCSRRSKERCEIALEGGESPIFVQIDGQCSESEQVCRIALVDITGRKLLEKTLAEQERLYRELFEGNPQPMWVYAAETMEFLAVNDAAIEHYGYSRQEFLQMTLRDLRTEEEIPALTASVKKARGKLSKAGLWQHRKKDSSLIDVEITTHDLLFNGRAARLVLINDITEQRRVEGENAAYLEKLRLMSQEMLMIEERERRQLAITLHDQIGQVLALAKIKLGALLAVDSAEECHLSAGRIRELLEQAISSSRTLTFELSAPVLYDLGFESAVQALCEKFQQQHGLRIEFVSDNKPTLFSEELRIFLFRAIRELLVNIVKYAGPCSVQVSCRRIDQQLTIVVSDDGNGFNAAAPVTPSPETGGFGLFSIRERLRHLGGEMTVDSAPGCGTRVSLTAKV